MESKSDYAEQCQTDPHEEIQPVRESFGTYGLDFFVEVADVFGQSYFAVGDATVYEP